MTLPVILVLSVAGLLLIIFIALYNSLVKARNLVQTAYADIDVHLTKRFNLVPNLVATSKGYAQYESDLLLGIVQQRSGKTSDEMERTAENDAQLTRSLSQWKITVEKYPDLKANASFSALMAELSRIEEHLVFARRFYNGATRDFNNKIQSFPASLIAGPFGFKARPFYEIGSAEQREVPAHL